MQKNKVWWKWYDMGQVTWSIKNELQTNIIKISLIRSSPTCLHTCKKNYLSVYVISTSNNIDMMQSANFVLFWNGFVSYIPHPYSYLLNIGINSSVVQFHPKIQEFRSHTGLCNGLFFDHFMLKSQLYPSCSPKNNSLSVTYSQ